MGRWFVVVMATLVLGACGGCKPKRPAADPAYVAAVERHRSERLAKLTSDTGWLTLVGIHWLKPGVNRLGTDPGDDIVLSGRAVSGFSGELDVTADGSVLLRTSSEARAAIKGAPVTEATLRSDRQGDADVVEIGGLRLNVIDRGGSPALRVRDPHSPRRAGFKGIPYYPIDLRFRIEATFERYGTPREVMVASAQGPAQRMLAPGLLRFRVGAAECSLEPFAASAEATSLFVVFSDESAGRETYGAGRFLDADAPAQGERVILDFNLAYNPPCAFTPYATCPLPPARNVLPVPIEAGEKFAGDH